MILFGFMAYYGFSLNFSLLLVPFILFFTWITALGIGTFLSAINAKYRDVRFILPFFVQLMTYITPVIYPASVAGQFRWIVELNPLTGLIEAHRSTFKLEPENFLFSFTLNLIHVTISPVTKLISNFKLNMNITVIGTGYVGVVTSVVLADFGNNVWGLDIDTIRVKNLTKAIPPIYEPGLEDLLKRGVKSGRLQFTTSYKEALAKTDIIFICVGTPQSDTGEVDTQYVFAAIEAISHNLINESIIILKSTVPPGIHRQLRKILDKNTKVKYEFASIPEFLREGSAIKDTLNPSRIVIGIESEKAKETT